MNKTSIQTAPNAAPAVGAPGRVQQEVRRAGPVMKALTALASLRLTVALFVLSLVLVFFGTMAQMDQGLLDVLNRYFRTGLAWIPFQAIVNFGQVFFGVPKTAHLSGSFPFPGGWLLGSLLLGNLVAAHAIRFKISWKRSGILLIHSGLIILMLSELVTGLYAVEGKMAILQGDASNYVEDWHATELAVVDSSNPKADEVTVIPAWMLKKGGVIRDEALPFDVEVNRYMVNSQSVRPGADQENPATAGAGLQEVAVESPPVSGVDGEKADIPAAYVTFKKKGTGESLGTYLVSVLLGPQTASVDGKGYEVALRHKRMYKPYAIRLLEFRHDRYLGTDTPRNYSSLVQLTDPSRGEDREVKIYMNNPLRYGGETFYQSSFIPGDRPGEPDKGTVLQVVRNPGWLMPYVSCTMISLGMMVHFGLHLIGFLRRRAAS
jgi:hypothetical protein